MPNWCSNEITITFDDTQELGAFVSKFSNREDTQKFFDLYVPTPKELLEVSHTGLNHNEFINAIVGNKSIEYTDWYNWRLAYWGTKWDVDVVDLEVTDNTVRLSCDTAWSPATEFWVALSKQYLSATIEVQYLEEGMNFAGWQTIRNGELDDLYMNEIPIEMYVAAGATLNDKGEIDWDTSDYNLWDVMDRLPEFIK